MARMTLEGNSMRGMLAVANKQYVLSQLLTGTFAIAADMPNFLFLDPNGSTRTVLLPPEAAHTWVRIFNTADGANEYLNVAEDAGVTFFQSIAPGENGMYVSNGTTWYGSSGGAANSVLLGAPAAQPASGSVTARVLVQYPFFRIDWTLTLARITVTDAAGSGSSGSLQLWDYPQAAIVHLGCRLDFTAFAEGAALTTAAGDAAFIMALGSVAANAGDGALTGTEIDISTVATGVITLSGGTGVGTIVGAASPSINGTTTASDVFLNWSGSAATIDANSTIDVTGTISLAGVFLGDD